MKLLLILALLQTLSLGVTAEPGAPSGDDILARVEGETNRRHTALKEYSGSRQYDLRNQRFGKYAAVTVLMNYREAEGERYTVVTRSGSDKLNGIIDRVLASETEASLPGESALHQLTAANYRVSLAGTGGAGGRNCYILTLAPKTKSRFLIIGKAWVDIESYAVIRLEGQFAASMSILVGAPRIAEEFVAVHGFWLPGSVRSVTSSLLLGPTELEIHFSNYRFEGGEGSSPDRAGEGGGRNQPR